MLWSRIDCDLRRLVVRGRGFNAARVVSRELHALVDLAAVDWLADDLARAFGIVDAVDAARWMAQDLATPSRVGWAAALDAWDRAVDGRFAATPTEGSWARWFDTIRAGDRPSFRPVDAYQCWIKYLEQMSNECVWDCCPYDPFDRSTRVVVIVGNHTAQQRPRVYPARRRALVASRPT